jgi:CheY-like chemotaxis protein
VVLSFARRDGRVEDEELEGLFEPFRGVGSPRPHLAAARALAHAHGGRIWALNREGGGSTVFSLELAKASEAAEGEATPSSGVVEDDETGGGAATVLVVDDDKGIRAVLRKFLTKAGYEVSEAWSGRSAMAQITGGRRPDLMVTDLRMLDGSGFWLLDQLQRYFPELLRFTVILTGDGRRGRELSEKTGCPLMVKPLELSALVDQLDRLSA